MKQKNYTQNQRLDRIEKTINSLGVIIYNMQTELKNLKETNGLTAEAKL